MRHMPGHTAVILFDFAVSPTGHIVQELSKWRIIKRERNYLLTIILGVFLDNKYLHGDTYYPFKHLYRQ